MKIKKNVFRVKKFSIIWIGKSNTVMTEIKKALVAEEQSRQSYNLVSLFSSLQHYINQLLKLLKEKREKKKKQKEIKLISVLF